MTDTDLFIGKAPPPFIRATGTEIGLAVSANFEVTGTTGDIRFGPFTPKYNIYFRVDYHFIAIQSIAAYHRMDSLVQLLDGTSLLAQADANGESQGRTHIMENHTDTLQYRTCHPQAIFKLVANQTYVVRPLGIPVSGTWSYWRGPVYTAGHSHVVGFW